MGLPRFRLRSLMIVVAAAAVVIWGGAKVVPWARTMWSVSRDHRKLANFLRSNPGMDLANVRMHEARAQAFLNQEAPQDGTIQRQAQKEMREAAYYRRLAAYHIELERVHRQIAGRPWATWPPFPAVPTRQ